MNWRKAILAVVLLIPAFWLLSQGFGTDPHAIPFVLENKPASPFVLPTLDGKSFDLTAQRGKPVVLNFWSTWCVPCKEEYPVLKNMAEQHGKSVIFAGIVYQDTPEAAKLFIEKFPLPFPQLIDAGSKVAMDHGVTGVPETLFIDAKGNIRRKHSGALTIESMQAGLAVIALDPRVREDDGGKK